MNNDFVKQFEENINFIYTCFDRVVIRGYIKKLIWEGGLVLFLRAMGFKKQSSKVMRIFTDQLNDHKKKRVRAQRYPDSVVALSRWRKGETSIDMWKSIMSIRGRARVILSTA